MSDQDWKETLFESPVVRHQVEQPMKIELPPGAQAERVAAAPPPGQAELRAVLDNPVLAAQLWSDVQASAADRGVIPPVTAQASAANLANIGLCIYLLYSIHFTGRPGHEHLPGGDDPRPWPEDDETR